MVYLNILIGLGVVLASAAAAIYFSQPTYQQTPPYRHRRRRNDEDADEFDGGKRQSHFTQQRTRRSQPGDRCSICLEDMSQEQMHEMKCGHAVHKECFEEYRYLRRNCPLCSQTVNLSLPGDNCTICLDPLERVDMVFLRCQHAMHKLCYMQFIDSGAKLCSLCREGL